ncbi:MAG: SDR family NAD(P)-dependent oxidoreductase [Bacteroidales bacterium]|jgi:short-subunit dehydrogenase|nr:SDR family NAD(P)-dependent oxidoreductase [Bacteroidales bacterium]
MKNIVITGSSRGIGYGLAREFLKKGHRVCISGRNNNTLKSAAENLEKETSNNKISYEVCDVTTPDDIEKLWITASSHGNIDIWVNNAGMGQETKYLTELDKDKISQILEVNLKGLILCSRFALNKMREQGSGAIYNMEGFGSDGRKMKKMIVYGTTKNALRYFTRSLALESSETPVIVGAISPGMVVTELLTGPISENNATNREALKIFNILSDRVETVTPFLVKKMLGNKKNGKTFNWLNGRKVMIRFMKNMFIKRHVEGLPELS